MLQRSPIKPPKADEIEKELFEAISEYREAAQDARSDDKASSWDDAARAAKKCDALIFQFFAAMSEECGENAEYAGSFGDLEYLAETRAGEIRDDLGTYDATSEHRIGCFEAGVGRYGSWGW